MSTYLVTGGAGFIGSHIVEELVRRGESVRVLDNFATAKRENLKPFLDRIEKSGGWRVTSGECSEPRHLFRVSGGLVVWWSGITRHPSPPDRGGHSELPHRAGSRGKA